MKAKTVSRERHQRRQAMVARLWERVQGAVGEDPFLIAARQNISISVHLEESEPQPDSRRVSRFHPDVMTIEIFARPLKRFWNELYPGCNYGLKYKYVCWRELWNYWTSQRFAPISHTLDRDWAKFIREFSEISQQENQYFSHYFAALATGLLEAQQEE